MQHHLPKNKFKTKWLTFIALATMLSTFSISSAQETYNEAYATYKKGELEKSIELFTKSISKKEKTAESYMYRGSANTKLRKLDEGKKDLDMAFRLDPKIKDLMYFFGMHYLVKGDAKNAIDYFDKAVINDPTDAESYCLRGAAKASLGDYQNAIKDGDKSIEIDPSEETNYTNRGYTKLLMKQYEEAITDFDAGIKIEPTQRGYANRGLAYASLQSYTFAISSFNKSLEISPKDPLILFYRGNCYEILEKFDQACEDYTLAKSIAATGSTEDIDKGIERLKCLIIQK